MMDEKDVDYHIDQDLEELFHSDMQNLGLGHGEKNHDDVIGDHLPEWLVGVIVVIAMLIVAFFVMIITSFVKNRKKHRSSTYIGAGSHATCDDLESGKICQSDEPSMKMTSFTSVPDTMNGSPSSPQSGDSGDNDRLTTGRGQCMRGAQGCKNPLFVDDGPDSDDNNSRGTDVNTGTDENNILKKPDSINKDIPSTSGGVRGSDVTENGKSKGGPNKYKVSSNTKKPASLKSDPRESDKLSESEGDSRKRMFMSKSKCANQTTNKKERTKGIHLTEIASQEGDKPGTEESEDVAQLENDIRLLNETNEDSNFHVKDTRGCSEDSGVELSSPESQLNEEIGVGSESDDIASGIIANGSGDITIECIRGHEVDIAGLEVNVSTSMFLNKEEVNLPGTDNINENSLHVIDCSQESSSSCCSVSLEVNKPTVQEGQHALYRERLDSGSSAVECMPLKTEVQENIGYTEATSHTDQHLPVTKMVDGNQVNGNGTELYSDLKSTDDVDMTVSGDEDELHDTSSPLSTSITTTLKDLVPTELSGNDGVLESDKVLSTNL